MEKIRVSIPQGKVFNEKAQEKHLSEAYEEIRNLEAYSKLKTEERVEIEHVFYMHKTADSFKEAAMKIIKKAS